MENITELTYHPSTITCTYKGCWEVISDYDILSRSILVAFHRRDNTGYSSFFLAVKSSHRLNITDTMLEWVFTKVKAAGGPDELAKKRTRGEKAHFAFTIEYED